MEPKDPGFTPSNLGPFDLDGIHVDPGLNEVSHGNRSVRLEPRVMQLLLFLAEHAHETCTRETIMSAVWVDSLPNEEALTQAISKLRKALNDSDRTLIETVRKVGYRLNESGTPVVKARQAGRAGMNPNVGAGRSWIWKAAAVLLVGFALSRFKVIAIKSDHIDGESSLQLRLSENDGLIRARIHRVEGDSTRATDLNWVTAAAPNTGESRE